MDHWIYFASESARARFVEAVAHDGFTVDKDGLSRDDNGRFGVSVYREDPVELAHVHAVVMALSGICAPRQLRAGRDRVVGRKARC